MSEYKEEDYLWVSGVQHFAFCKRQWALIAIENQWGENLKTTEGRIMHKRVHEPAQNEKRKDTIIVRALPIHSVTLGLSGECDVVEFHRDANGVYIPKWQDLFKVFPVEYKRGSPKKENHDRLQLTAQVLCLEEMLCCEIPEAFLYYGEIRHREKVLITEELKTSVYEIAQEMHALYRRRHTPLVRRKKACNSCSLKGICIPQLEKSTDVNKYIYKTISEDESH